MIPITSKFVSDNTQDAFFTALTDAFIDILELGLVAVSVESAKFESELTASVFRLGLNCVKDCLDPIMVKVMVRAKGLSVINKNPNISDNEIIQISLLEDIIICLQMENFEEFLSYQNAICDGNVDAENRVRLLRCNDELIKRAKSLNL